MSAAPDRPQQARTAGEAGGTPVSAQPLQVAILVFDEVEALDLGGPYEVFTTASRMHQRQHPGALEPFVVQCVARSLAPVRAGDYIEAVGRIVSMGKSSRKMVFEARKVISAVDLPGQPSACDVLPEPVVVCKASGTCVVPVACQRR